MPTIIYRRDKQLHSTGSCIQYPVINHNGKYEKECVCVCVYIYIYIYICKIESIHLKHNIANKLEFNFFKNWKKIKRIFCDPCRSLLGAQTVYSKCSA